uniref:carboxypeptidase-like regulatory domain-containing protein n=1 Tax=Mariniflexile sp. TaxID=1979402 RepID=UPI004047D7A8
MNLKTKLILVGILFFNISLFAQNTYVVSGTVSDAYNVPIPGVNVIVAGTSRGAATDFDGKYQLEVKSGEKLKFSFLGYVSQTVAITGQKQLDITLAEDASSIKEEELNAFPVLDATQALQGRAAGVVVQSNNGGEPGAPINIKIRGNTSINASSSPLIVVDGFVGASMPQANDIQSMEVLKDASATAI